MNKPYVNPLAAREPDLPRGLVESDEEYQPWTREEVEEAQIRHITRLLKAQRR